LGKQFPIAFPQTMIPCVFATDSNTSTLLCPALIRSQIQIKLNITVPITVNNT